MSNLIAIPRFTLLRAESERIPLHLQLPGKRFSKGGEHNYPSAIGVVNNKFAIELARRRNVPIGALLIRQMVFRGLRAGGLRNSCA